MTKSSSAHASARPRIVLTAGEHAVLTSLAERSAARDTAVGEYLAEELSRAYIVPDDARTPNVVRMGSKVTYREEKTGRTRTVTVVYPREADIEQQRVSVLTPIGAALIGLSPTQSIEWQAPDGEPGLLTVLAVEQAEPVSQ